MAKAEEVSERNQNTRPFGIVPGYLQEALPVVSPLGHPDVRDGAGTPDVGEEFGLTRFDSPSIAVPARLVP